MSIFLHPNSARRVDSLPRRGLRSVSPGRAAGTVVFAVAVCLIAASHLVTREARAQENGAAETGIARTESLEMIVRAGFGRLEVSNWTGSWVPFRVSLANQGPPISGRLIVHCESSGNPTPQVREYVKEIQLPAGMGKTVLVSSHILTERADFCTSIGIIEAGRLLASGRIDEITARLAGNVIVDITVKGDPLIALKVLAERP